MEHKKRSKSTWEKFRKTFTINSSTLSGCLDIIVTEDKFGKRKSTDFHLIIGKMKTIQPENKRLNLYLNKNLLAENMYISKNGEGRFFYKRKKFDDDFLYADFKEIHKKLVFIRAGKLMFNVIKSHKLKEKKKELTKIQISNCGKDIDKSMEYEDINKIFKKNIISKQNYDKLTNKQINNLDIVIKINHSIYKNINPDTIPHLVHFTPNEIIKSTKPSESFIKNLDLKKGPNSLIYVFKGNLGKTYSISTRIFFYPYKSNYRVIISDIDGTITKSDILGHIMPIFKMGWAHKSICEFYSNLVKRNYIIVYLTARNIGQSSGTKKYLNNLKQNKIKLPIGPTITSTQNLFGALHTEVIKKNPELNKIKVIKELFDIFGGNKENLNQNDRVSKFEKRFLDFNEEMKNERASVWNRNYNPIFAGFGNKNNDTFAYKECNIDHNMIFQINTKSKIKIYGNEKILTYEELNKNIDEHFPIFDLEEI